MIEHVRCTNGLHNCGECTRQGESDHHCAESERQHQHSGPIDQGNAWERERSWDAANAKLKSSHSRSDMATHPQRGWMAGALVIMHSREVLLRREIGQVLQEGLVVEGLEREHGFASVGHDACECFYYVRVSTRV